MHNKLHLGKQPYRPQGKHKVFLLYGQACGSLNDLTFMEAHKRSLSRVFPHMPFNFISTCERPATSLNKKDTVK